jgi:VanZ family protein
LISLAIETTQGFIPSRDSSQRDVVCNTLGGLLGAWVASASSGSEPEQP